MGIALVFVGGGIGAVSRYASSVAITNFFGTMFPLGTLLVNLAGSLVMGFLYTVFERLTVAPEWRLFLLTGFLGGFTTFSSFSMETVNLLREGETAGALANILASLILGLLSIVAGVLLASLLFRGVGEPR